MSIWYHTIYDAQKIEAKSFIALKKSRICALGIGTQQQKKRNVILCLKSTKKKYMFAVRIRTTMREKNKIRNQKRIKHEKQN